MKKVFKKELALKLKNENNILFEFEEPNQTHSYVLFTSFDALMVKIQESNYTDSSFWHETIFANAPCRYFFDCESKNPKVISSVNVDEYVERFHLEFKKIMNLQEVKPPIIFIASRLDKLSYHLIYEEVAPDPSYIKIVADILDNTKIMGVDVDTSVYPNIDSVFHSFRAPFQKKREGNESTRLLLHKQNNAMRMEFTPHEF